jgi:hypothetical protein
LQLLPHFDLKRPQLRQLRRGLRRARPGVDDRLHGRIHVDADAPQVAPHIEQRLLLVAPKLRRACQPLP